MRRQWWRGLADRIRIMFVLSVIALCVPSVRAESATPPIVRVTATVSSPTVNQKPWLVIFVFDKSGSMLGKCEEDPTGARRSNWLVVVEDANRKLEQLHSTLPTFDLRVYAFGTKASDFAHPIGERTYSVKSDEDVKDLKTDFRAMPAPKTGETTNLWTSLKNVFDGIRTTNAGSNYGGVAVIVFSDGADEIPGNTSTENRLKGMRAALESARASTEIRLSVLPIGEWKRVPERLKQLGSIAEIAALGIAIEVPKVTSYAITPAIATLEPMPVAGRTSSVTLQLQGFDSTSASAVKATLRDQTPGLTLASPSFSATGATLQFSAAKPLELGASATVDLSFLDASGTKASSSFKVTVPAFKLVAPIASWGLPPECDALGKRRAVILELGEPLDLAISVPVDATVNWLLDGNPVGSSATLHHVGLIAGAHDLKISVATSNEQKAADAVVIVIDSRLQIDGPSSARAGDAVAFSASVPTLPPELSQLLTPATWTHEGAEASPSEKLTVRFNRRGTERVSVRRSLDVCGEQVTFTASQELDVRAGPALRLRGGELVRGRDNRVEATLSGVDEISKVIIEIEGKQLEANIDAARGDSQATAWVSFKPTTQSTISIRAIPVLKDDRGVDRSVTDEECRSRAQSRTFTVVDPDVVLVLSEPKSGEQKSFGFPFKILAAPQGRDAESVNRVAIQLRSSAGDTTNLDLNRAGGWSASFTPTTVMGGSLSIEAQAFDSTGAIGEPVKLQLELTSVEPALTLTGTSKTGVLSWTGRNEAPAPVTAAIVAKGTEVNYAMAELASVEWSVEGSGIEFESKSSTDPTATFRVLAAGQHTMVANVRTPDGKSYVLKVEVNARPEQLIASPELVDSEVSIGNPIELSHENTKGAWTHVKLRVRRENGEWIPLDSNGMLSPEPTRDESFVVEAWYRPWGAPDSDAPWDGASGWTRSRELEATAVVPRNWMWPIVATVIALMICWRWWVMCSGHEYPRAKVSWCRTDYIEPGSRFRTPMGQIGQSRSLQYKFLTRTAFIDLPTAGIRANDAEYGWLAKLRGSAGGLLRRRVAHIQLDHDGACDFLLEDGTSEIGCISRPNRVGTYTVKVSPPQRLRGGPEGDDWQPIYLFVHPTEDTKYHVNVRYKFFYACGVSSLILMVLAWLILSRTI